MKKISLLSLLAIVILCAVNVFAGLLPGSSYRQGTTYLGTPDDGVRVDFAVYDTLGGNEFADAGFTVPGADPGQYTYVYEITNNVTGSDFPVRFFTLTGIGNGAITAMDIIGSTDDSPLEPGNSGIAPDDTNFSADLSKASWVFNDSLIVLGEHSWFLILSSDHTPKAGNIQLTPISDEGAVVPNPEPATLSLFGLGAMLLKRKR